MKRKSPIINGVLDWPRRVWTTDPQQSPHMNQSPLRTSLWLNRMMSIDVRNCPIPRSPTRANACPSVAPAFCSAIWGPRTIHGAIMNTVEAASRPMNDRTASWPRTKVSPPRISTRRLRRSTPAFALGGRSSGSSTESPTAYRIAWSQKAPSSPHTAITGHAVAGPRIIAMFVATVLTAIAPTSLSWGTRLGRIAVRTGVPMAMKVPDTTDDAINQGTLMAPDVTIAEMNTVTARHPAWLANRRVRRFMWSLMTPTGSEMSRAGMPITKRMTPLMSLFAPRSSARATKANRWVLWTRMNRNELSQSRRNGLIRRRSVGRIPCGRPSVGAGSRSGLRSICTDYTVSHRVGEVRITGTRGRPTPEPNSARSATRCPCGS